MNLTPDQQDTLGRIDSRLKLVEVALERAVRDGGAAALGADLRFLGVAEITIDGRPLEEIGARMAAAIAEGLKAFRCALFRAVSELEDERE